MTDLPSTDTPDATIVPPPADDASVPRRFARYEIERVTGKGAMGWVVLARDLTLQRPVALKLFRVAGSDETKRRVKKRYVDEARAAARLVHPNILQIYEVGLFGGWVYIAMEVLPGGDLKTLVRSRGPMGWYEACRLIQQAADGLAYAHQQGMIHRDIKPANLMLSQRGDCKVVDFGLTTRIDAPIGEPGAGTPNYQSPESARGHNGPQNDVWGLAASLWFLLTGAPPFDLETPGDVLRVHVGLHLPDLRALRPDVPEPVVRVVEQALAKNPGERFHLAEDFARVLKLAVEHATHAHTGPLPAAFQRPVNPELVELAGAVDSSGGSALGQSHSRSTTHSRSRPAPVKPTPVWLYLLIALLLVVAMAGTAVVLIGMEDGPADAGDAPPANPPAPPGTLEQAVAEDLGRITWQIGAGSGLAGKLVGLRVAAETEAPGFPAPLAIDGDPDTYWQNDNRGWGTDQYDLDLGEVLLLESVQLLWGEPPPGEARVLISLTGENGDWREFSAFAPVDQPEDIRQVATLLEARYLQIETQGLANNAPPVRLREIDLIYE